MHRQYTEAIRRAGAAVPGCAREAVRTLQPPIALNFPKVHDVESHDFISASWAELDGVPGKFALELPPPRE